VFEWGCCDCEPELWFRSAERDPPPPTDVLSGGSCVVVGLPPAPPLDDE
jgi:hypothetical protein